MFILFASAFINAFTTTIPKMDYDAPSNDVVLYKNDEYIEGDYDYMYSYESFNSYEYENYYIRSIKSNIPGAIDSINTSMRYLNYKLDILHNYLAELSSYI